MDDFICFVSSRKDIRWRLNEDYKVFFFLIQWSDNPLFPPFSVSFANFFSLLLLPVCRFSCIKDGILSACKFKMLFIYFFEIIVSFDLSQAEIISSEAFDFSSRRPFSPRVWRICFFKGFCCLCSCSSVVCVTNKNLLDI